MENLKKETLVRFGRLLVCGEAGRSRWGHILWEVLCDCGTRRVVIASHVRNGLTQSCGCLRDDRIRAVKCGVPLSQETKKRLSQIRKGRKLSESHKEKIRKSHLGEKNHFFGKKHSGETKRKMQKAAQGKRSGKQNGMFGKVGPLHPLYGRRGLLHPGWKGGMSRLPYSLDWTPQLRQEIKERDGNRCLNPVCDGHDPVLSIHHVNYKKKDCSKTNLITICRSCNSAANKDRRWHEAWYAAIMYQRGYHAEQNQALA